MILGEVDPTKVTFLLKLHVQCRAAEDPACQSSLGLQVDRSSTILHLHPVQQVGNWKAVHGLFTVSISHNLLSQTSHVALVNSKESRKYNEDNGVWGDYICLCHRQDGKIGTFLRHLLSVQHCTRHVSYFLNSQQCFKVALHMKKQELERLRNSCEMPLLISGRAKIWILPSDSMVSTSARGQKGPETCWEVRGAQRSALDMLALRGDAASP